MPYTYYLFKKADGPMENEAVDFNNYIQMKVGYYGDVLKLQMTFDNKTSLYDIIMTNANHYFKMIENPKNPGYARLNTDVLDVIILSFHPESALKKANISKASLLALNEVNKFHDLLLLEEDYSGMVNSSYAWIMTATSEKMTFPAQMTLMTWFLTLVRMKTGEKEDILLYRQMLLIITVAMSERFKWGVRSQFKDLQEMKLNLEAEIQDGAKKDKAEGEIIVSSEAGSSSDEMRVNAGKKKKTEITKE